MITTIIVIAVVLAVLAVALFIEARKSSKRDLKPFQPLPKSPSDADANTLDRLRRDSEIEAEWRRNVVENELRRKENKPLSSMLIRQAD